MEATTAVMWLTLVTMVTPTSDNVTEAGFDYNVTMSPGKSRSSYSSSFYVSPIVSMVFYVATCTIAVTGFLANGYVLLALLFNKNSRKNNVNAFITHQTILDLTACIFLFIGLMVRSTEMDDSLAFFVCVFFQNYAVSITDGNASICGLVIITIERYVKIVYPVVHRNHYRPWMTRVGIIIPWIFGICMYFIPTLVTSRVVRGRCFRGRVGSTPELRLTWSVASFLLLYLGPLAVFVFGYGKILAVIRRQGNQVGQSQQGTSNAATAAQKSNKRTERNVIRTMVLVSMTFAISFGCMRVYSILTALKAVPAIGTLYLVFSVFAYTSRCLNPFIYAKQYEIVRNWWRVIVCRVVRRQHVEDAPIATPAAPATDDKQKTTKTRTTTMN